MSVTIVVRKLDLKNLFYRGNQMFRSNITSTNPLVDGPDYTFLDGRRTPLRPRQRRRAQGQKEQVTRALEFMKQIGFRCGKA
ncbi:39S ribosomal protein L52, mitochondrial [Armadillidium vulgare]|nr:39S ribosomal protein L52, mitochondrial [Armadillidium vulgare]